MVLAPPTINQQEFGKTVVSRSLSKVRHLGHIAAGR